MKILLIVVIYFIVLSLIANRTNLLIIKSMPKSYFEYDKYRADKNHFKNIKVWKHLIFLRIYPDSIYPRQNLKFIFKFRLLVAIPTAIFTLFLAIVFALDINFYSGIDFSEEKMVINIFIGYAIFLLIDYSLLSYHIKKSNIKNTNYYNTVYYRALLLGAKTLKKKGLVTKAVLPIGYTNLHFFDKYPKKTVTSIRINRDKNIAQLYYGKKAKNKLRYFDLKNIENTEFLDKFINDLTFVENEVDLKGIFNDFYFSDKDLLVIADYSLKTSDEETITN